MLENNRRRTCALHNHFGYVVCFTDTDIRFCGQEHRNLGMFLDVIIPKGMFFVPRECSSLVPKEFS